MRGLRMMLTNKSIATEVGEKLYSVFNKRYADVKDEIEKDLGRRLPFRFSSMKAYSSKNFNYVITE